MTRYTQPAADRLALLARALRTTADLLGLEADGAESPEVMRALVTSAEQTVREIGAIVWRLEGRATDCFRSWLVHGHAMRDAVAHGHEAHVMTDEELERLAQQSSGAASGGEADV